MSKVIITIDTNNPAKLVRVLEKKNVQISNSEEQYTVSTIEVQL